MQSETNWLCNRICIECHSTNNDNTNNEKIVNDEHVVIVKEKLGRYTFPSDDSTNVIHTNKKHLGPNQSLNFWWLEYCWILWIPRWGNTYRILRFSEDVVYKVLL